ncbi:5-methyltetrahydropteroyltriglutamate--homocysteine S-methyltransferase [Rhizobiaceae bacterium n13]|uniref:5-methyltetrahydropteroyltriglutamate--homocysteine methyltransferase n=1 Tax=Ferirhizobium litorale TaxID=2927786 RepID=A0AAE3QIZ2_9HYPH|nr:5-methyltetrahydropteroyltriglutamate--homocysteine S-methyltransferase [Fererhizobium litorale]MDI7862726.1 5-methyltetrahydropteroyltriglutamate--homocysteine S-methyltransferase [Fererhizobium litorale]MDI7924410.1 5-methyltetrahydropteroyltriglutamate--homocysteine S-methyltransferase [Fererhizobium litorale]
MTIKTANLGFPRIGRHRELKFALESYWAGKSDRAALLDVASKLRAANWLLQKEMGIDVIPSNDFSLYDQVLDTAVMVGAIPSIYGWQGGSVDLDTYFAMARGSNGGHAACGHAHQGNGVPALEMTKWFDTNYHYLVPEFSADQHFELTSNKPLEAFLEARTIGVQTRPVLLGPVTFLKLGKTRDGSSAINLLDRLLPVYARIFAELAAAGADWVQVDEPCLVLDLGDEERQAVSHAYAALHALVPDLRIMLATYFGALGDNLDIVARLPVSGIHVDLVSAPQQAAAVLEKVSPQCVISLGVIDGRNIWRSDLAKLRDTILPLIGGRDHTTIQLAPSCSLLHVPIDVSLETTLDDELRSWLAFATQKLEELKQLSGAIDGSDIAVAADFRANGAATQARLTSVRVNDPIVAGRLVEIQGVEQKRHSPFAKRKDLQRRRFGLPPFPTTTIGSFPQTADVRKARSMHDKGELSYIDYKAFIERETAAAVRWQEEIGLDVFVHGEFERNDMVQYFGEQLSGFAFTRHAWVQSYGSRYVRPPIIYGDVSRPNPMTVGWWRYAQSLTQRPMKGMLTGPITILNWSFVRDDLPRETVGRQIALAIRDEVLDLEEAGAGIIQIDEAALREGLPLRKADWQHYLGWAVECFRMCTSGVADETQIHTHMCYSEFNDIMSAIAAMDADVISIETSRSKMKLLQAFAGERYPNEIGPGVYDIHSPRVPDAGEMKTLLDLAREHLLDDQLWVNPDCGLKTRKWEDVKPALVNMVEAARRLRLDLAGDKGRLARA